MNVLLAEANAAYDQHKDHDEINSQFANTDVVLVVGANDVTNPAARRPGNAVSGMPILDVDKARSIIVIKRSLGHGYAGIDNERLHEPEDRDAVQRCQTRSLQLCSPSCTPTSTETRPRPTGDLRLWSARRALGILWSYKQRRRCVMRALVIYESMYGNTHQIAEAIAEGMDLPDDVAVLPVSEATQTMLDQVDLIVVGGPTHAHGMSRERTRKAAVDAAKKPSKALHLDPTAAGVGLRDWFDSLGTVHGMAAAFDTRNEAPAVFTGRAATGIAKMLRQHGMTLVAESGELPRRQAQSAAAGRAWPGICVGENLAHTLTSLNTTT